MEKHLRKLHGEIYVNDTHKRSVLEEREIFRWPKLIKGHVQKRHVDQLTKIKLAQVWVALKKFSLHVLYFSTRFSRESPDVMDKLINESEQRLLTEYSVNDIINFNFEGLQRNSIKIF